MDEVFGIIEDGYTEPFFIKGKEKMYPAVTGEFRPMTLTEQSEFSKDAKKFEKSEDQNGLKTLHAKWLAKHITRWDMVGRKGAIDITTENMMKLKDELFFRLFKIIFL